MHITSSVKNYGGVPTLFINNEPFPAICRIIFGMENAAPITEFVTGGMVDIHGDCGDYCYKNFRHSLCHGWASAPTPWLAKYVLGINILEPGCTKVCISPHLPNLSFAKGTYPTPYGNIEVSYRKEDGKIITEYTAPAEIEVCLHYNEYKK